MNIRRKILIVVTMILIVCVFLIPVKGNIKDGGSKYYHPMIPIYEVVEWNGLFDDETKTTGTTVKLFGIEIYVSYHVVE